MTIQFLRYWDGHEQYSVASLSASEELRLIGLGLARSYEEAIDGASGSGGSMVTITPSLLVSPTAAMLADTKTVYQLSTTKQLYVSNGTLLSPVGSGTYEPIPSITKFDGNNIDLIQRSMRIALGKPLSRQIPKHVIGSNTNTNNSSTGGYQTKAIYHQGTDSMYFCPAGAATRIAIINCKTKALSYSTTDLTGSVGCGAGVLLPDGRILFVPISGSAPHLVIYDPVTGTTDLSILTQTAESIALNGANAGKFAGACLAHTLEVIMSPYSGNKTWGVFDYRTNTFRDGAVGATSGNFECCVQLPNGKVAAQGNTNNKIALYDPVAHTVADSTSVPAVNTAPQGWGVHWGDTWLYLGTNANTNQVGLYNWKTDTHSYGEYMSTYNFVGSIMFSGCETMADGSVIAIPRTGGRWLRYSQDEGGVIDIIDSNTPEGTQDYLGGGADPYGRIWLCPGGGKTFDYLETFIPDDDDGTFRSHPLFQRY